jgi:hypothetical protein
MEEQNKFSTSSYGLGDIRVTAYKWLLNPLKFEKETYRQALD